ncbi:hypothetical protein YC2023_091578 [Brassica napus]
MDKSGQVSFFYRSTIRLLSLFLFGLMIFGSLLVRSIQKLSRGLNNCYLFFVEEKKEKLSEIKSGLDEADLLVFPFILPYPENGSRGKKF